MTRLVAGIAGGRRLVVPDGVTTRPTSERVREAMFSTLTTLLGTWRGVVVVDLYSGSGALGLEALSRGAQRCLFVERDRRALGVLERNIASTGLPGATVRSGDVASVLASSPPEPADLVLLDPPYSLPADGLVAVLEQVCAQRWLAKEGVVVVERASREAEPGWPSGLNQVRERRYGETRLWYLRRSDDRSRPAS